MMIGVQNIAGFALDDEGKVLTLGTILDDGKGLDVVIPTAVLAGLISILIEGRAAAVAMGKIEREQLKVRPVGTWEVGTTGLLEHVAFVVDKDKPTQTAFKLDHGAAAKMGAALIAQARTVEKHHNTRRKN